MGRHQDRTDLGAEWGATDIVAERGADGIAKVMELTRGEGSHVVIEVVGLMPAYEQAYGVVRPGGVVSRVSAALTAGSVLLTLSLIAALALIVPRRPRAAAAWRRRPTLACG